MKPRHTHIAIIGSGAGRNMGTLGLVATGKRLIQSGEEFNQYFEPAKGGQVIMVKNGDIVNDTLPAMKSIVLNYSNQLRAIAPLFQRQTVEATLKAIFEFCYNHIQYRRDSAHQEELRTPARTWADRKKGVDCDCYSIFVAALIREVNFLPNSPKIKTEFRITKYNGRPNYQHVYVLATDVNSGKKYIIDPVTDQFNYEVPFSDKLDFPMALSGIPIAMLNGIEQENTSTDIQAAAAMLSDVRDPKMLDSVILNYIIVNRNYVAANYDVVALIDDPAALLKMLNYAIEYWNDPVKKIEALRILSANEQAYNAKFKLDTIPDDEANTTYIDGRMKKGMFTEILRMYTGGVNGAIQWLQRFNPLAQLGQTAYLLVLKTNMFKQAQRLAWGMYNANEFMKATGNTYSWEKIAQWRGLERAYLRAKTFFVRSGGEASVFDNTILNGSGNKLPFRPSMRWEIDTVGFDMTTKAGVDACFKNAWEQGFVSDNTTSRDKERIGAWGFWQKKAFFERWMTLIKRESMERTKPLLIDALDWASKVNPAAEEAAAKANTYQFQVDSKKAILKSQLESAEKLRRWDFNKLTAKAKELYNKAPGSAGVNVPTEAKIFMNIVGNEVGEAAISKWIEAAVATTATGRGNEATSNTAVKMGESVINNWKLKYPITWTLVDVTKNLWPAYEAGMANAKLTQSAATGRGNAPTAPTAGNAAKVTLPPVAATNAKLTAQSPSATTTKKLSPAEIAEATKKLQAGAAKALATAAEKLAAEVKAKRLTAAQAKTKLEAEKKNIADKLAKDVKALSNPVAVATTTPAARPVTLPGKNGTVLPANQPKPATTTATTAVAVRPPQVQIPAGFEKTPLTILVKPTDQLIMPNGYKILETKADSRTGNKTVTYIRPTGSKVLASVKTAPGAGGKPKPSTLKGLFGLGMDPVTGAITAAAITAGATLISTIAGMLKGSSDPVTGEGDDAATREYLQAQESAPVIEEIVTNQAYFDANGEAYYYDENGNPYYIAEDGNAYYFDTVLGFPSGAITSASNVISANVPSGGGNTANTISTISSAISSIAGAIKPASSAPAPKSLQAAPKVNPQVLIAAMQKHYEKNLITPDEIVKFSNTKEYQALLSQADGVKNISTGAAKAGNIISTVANTVSAVVSPRDTSAVVPVNIQQGTRSLVLPSNDYPVQDQPKSSFGQMLRDNAGLIVGGTAVAATAAYFIFRPKPKPASISGPAKSRKEAPKFDLHIKTLKK